MSISESEGVIMEALWRRHPRSAEEVIAEVADARGWSAATVKTLLNRLLTKQAIAAERDGRRYLYRPLIERTAYVSEESRSLVDRLFGGRVSSLVSHFSQQEQLSPDDVAELKRLIADLGDDD
jgi:predicted transcriptional regulator